MKKNKSGFTLLELVIVIAVVAILAAVLIPTFTGVINRSKLSNDIMLCKNLNTSAATIEDSDNKKPTTMAESLVLMNENGFKVSNIKASNPDSVFVWDSISNRYFIYDVVAGRVTYKDDNTTINLTDKEHKVNYWIISETYTQTNEKLQDFSVYLKSGYAGDAVIDVTTGVDCGDNNNISQINYVNTEKQNVVIRTNSSSTNVSIKDSSQGTIYHYGVAGELNIIECYTNSFHEFGTVAFAEVSKGRIVLEATSVVEQIHINKIEGQNKFDTVTIADNGTENLPKTITRDQIEVSENLSELVVKIEIVSTGATESIYVYPYTDSKNVKTGSTEQTQTQNAGVASLLGKLVLDNGSNAGEKAMSNNEKQEAKENIVETAISTEIVENSDSDKNYEARIGSTLYTKFIDAVNEATDGQTVTLLTDLTLGRLSKNDNVAVSISKSITINGGNHTIKTSAGRGIWIDENEVEVTIKNLNLIGTDVNNNNPMERGIQVNSNKDNVTVNIQNCNVVSKLYGVNICSGIYNIAINISNSTIQGWGAINAWSDGYKYIVKDSTLIGINYTNDKRSSFAVICLEGSNTDQSIYSSNNKVELTDCVLKAENPGDGRTNKQYIITFNQNSKENAVKLVNCEVITDETIGGFFLDLGTNNKVVLENGSYTFDPFDYISAGFASHNNGDGTYSIVTANYKVDVTTHYENITKDPSQYSELYVDTWSAGLYGAVDENGNTIERIKLSTDTTVYTLGEETCTAQEACDYFVNYYNLGYTQWASGYLYAKHDNVSSYYFETEEDANEFVNYVANNLSGFASVTNGVQALEN